MDYISNLILKWSLRTYFSINYSDGVKKINGFYSVGVSELST